MVRVSVDEIRRDPGKYFREVEAGEVVIVTRADRAVAEIRPVAADAGSPAPRPAGLAGGEFCVPDDFDVPLPPEVVPARRRRSFSSIGWAS